MIVRITLDGERLLDPGRAFQIDLLNLPGARVDFVVANGERLATDKYEVKDAYVTISKMLGKLDSVDIFIDIEANEIKSKISTSAAQRNGAIAVALIGLLGTILTAALKPEFIASYFNIPKIAEYVIVEPDNYGADASLSYFQSIIRWGKPTEKNYAFSPDIFDSHRGWYFLRVREKLDLLQELEIDNVSGPIDLKNGQMIKENISPPLKSRFCSGNGFLQMILVALPKNMRLTNGSKISDFGGNAKVLLSPAFGSKQGCK